MYDQRDIVLVPFPFTSSAATKVRPALVISNKKLNHTEDRICLQITSKHTPGELELSKEKLNIPLLARSWVKPTKIFTLDEKMIFKKISKITLEFHEKVLAELNSYLN